MKISDEGLRLIKSFEGYHTALSDGGCAAYLCPAKVPTIGWGCTEGVRLGMVWTQAEAEAGLLREIAKFESAVARLVTVELNQNEYDALVSFAYNVGAGGLQKSTLLKKLNAGDRAGAAKQFEKWTRGGGRVLPGLVSRRKREAALFLKPDAAPQDPIMPQQIDEPKPVKEALSGSKTIFGALIAMLGTVVQWFSEAMSGLGEAASHVAAWVPGTGVLASLGVDMKGIGFSLALGGIALVVWRRLDAAKQGKEG